MDKIILTVIGRQRFEDINDDYEMTTVGSLEETETQYIVRYREELEPSSDSVEVCVEISKVKPFVEVTRTNAAQCTCLTIEAARHHRCRYGTEYGDILMGISGKNIEAQLDGDVGTFLFEYTIDANGALVSENQVEMRFRKNQENEYVKNC